MDGGCRCCDKESRRGAGLGVGDLGGYLGGGTFEVPMRHPRKGSHVGSQIFTAGA